MLPIKPNIVKIKIQCLFETMLTFYKHRILEKLETVVIRIC